MKKIIIILPKKNFRDLEYIVPKAFFEKNNCQTETFSEKKISIGRFGYETNNQILSEDILVKNFDGIFFPGGLGSLDLIKNQIVKNLVQEFFEQNKIIGAICAAPRLLLSWGILNNKKCTGHNWDQNFDFLCKKNNAFFEKNANVVIDDNIITANGPEAAEEFAINFLKLLNK